MKFVATSVVRGSRQGESHGGVFIIDPENQLVRQPIDWNTVDIEWRGRGWDRGLRGIAFDGDVIYIAASDELFAYTPNFEPVGSWRSPYLKHSHEIAVYERTLFVTSTGYDSILGFNLDRQRFDWAMHVQSRNNRFRAATFDPMSDDGPLMLNKLHLNNIHCEEAGMYVSGLKSGGMLHFNGQEINMAVTLPAGTHNARPFRDGVLFNDTSNDVLRYTGRGEGEEDRALEVPKFDPKQLGHLEAATDDIARQGFARGLCVVNDGIVAGGSSPSTVTLYDLPANEILFSVNLSRDIRNTIHGLEIWPYDS
ncbi:MAG: hypothetical protein VX236_04505 [Pseudomonadota bacterium]|nr:hypothetical protein [Pseudomonadota bacterium]